MTVPVNIDSSEDKDEMAPVTLGIDTDAVRFVDTTGEDGRPKPTDTEDVGKLKNMLGRIGLPSELVIDAI